MKFWTTLGVKDRHTRRHWRARLFPYTIGGGVVMPKAAGLGPFAVIMVDPTEAELQALGNALIVDYSDSIVIALSPESLKCNEWVMDRKGRHADNHRIREWEQAHGESFKRVLNGHTGAVCTGCTKTIHRVSGACKPAYKGCTEPLFPEGSKITLPPMSLYLTPAQCIERHSFEGYSVHQLDTDRSPEDPIKVTVNTKSAFVGATTRYLKRISCAVCLFNTRTREDPQCGTCHSPQYCEGPYFDSDVPKEFPLVARENLRLMGTPVSKEAYLAECEKHASKLTWVSKAWRLDPELMIGYTGRGLGLDLQVIQTRKSKNNYDHERTTPDQWEAVKKAFCKPVTVDKPPTLFERLLLTMYAKGSLNVKVGSSGWGGPGWSCLYGVQYNDHSDSADVLYLLCSWKTSHHIRTVADLGRQYVGAYRSLSTSDRQESIVELLNSRKTNSSAVKQAEQIVGYLVQADKDVQAGSLDKMPSIAAVRSALCIQ